MTGDLFTRPMLKPRIAPRVEADLVTVAEGASV